ncbi:DUF6252 family protein [Flavobacterium degerlachei]|jgi:hypothetical protein|uniref:Lipocalin-like domain-containing protein n=1 Tax=Flavobacterium degerlachei TaxID=229203 RepID=A0A1H2PYK3_9FLAO|nr:DUF6252 family protein [Flavobacterium degerlachei]SDV99921.1 hypothetical protein SAMN05444338_10120 [Flavobacterium degerlachei]
MKKSILFVIVLFSLISCTEDVRFNNPSFQGVKDNVFWRAIESKATLNSNGSLVIEAYSGNEVITLKTTSMVEQLYPLGTSTSKTASYVLTDSNGTTTFTTGTGIGDGQIIITDYDAIENTVSGSFKFNAENIYNNPLAGAVLNFQQGIFYKVPIKEQLLTN